MTIWVATFLTVVLLITGCAANKQTAVPPDAASGENFSGESKLIVTPESLLVGNVAVYNSAGRFVVLDFPIGRMPAVDQVLFVYRQGLKVGEVKITGPERDHNTVGDLISGEAQKGDSVRDK